MGGQFAKKGPNNLAMQQVRARAASGARALRMAPTVSRCGQQLRVETLCFVFWQMRAGIVPDKI